MTGEVTFRLAWRLFFQATLLIAALNLLSRFFGLGREIVIAYQFGATFATDAYLVAFTIPSILFMVFSQALATVVVPVFTEYKARGETREAWRVSANVVNLLLFVLAAVTVFGILIAPLLVRLIAPGFGPEAAEVAVVLTRIMLPLLIFSGLATVFNGFLNANNIFGIPAFGGAVNNLVIIIGALTLGSLYGIQGLAYGTVLGMVASGLIQLPSLYRAGFRFRPVFDWRHPGVRKVFHLMLPITVGIAISQLYILIDRVLASFLVEGSIAALNFGTRLIQLPVSLFVLALSTAVFPTLTTWAAEGRESEVLDTLRRGLRIIVLTTLPAAVGLMVLRLPVVGLLFERGEFDERATAMTASAVLFYSVGLVGLAANILLTRGFYAFQDTRTPVKLLGVNVVLNLVLSLILMGPLQLGGLALASSLAALVNTMLLVRFLERRLPGLWHAADWLRFGARALAASGLMAGAVYTVNVGLAGLVPPGTAGLALQVGGGVIAGVTVYGAACLVLGLEEIGIVLRASGRLGGRIMSNITRRGR
ncbi:MAG: murein biosynthesis integral membrane protein MurJ [Candidatus Desulforudis sp.]|nr:murein biosynthesis integral membrane protein MurJ [Desulforudis sp.]